MCKCVQKCTVCGGGRIFLSSVLSSTKTVDFLNICLHGQLPWRWCVRGAECTFVTMLVNVLSGGGLLCCVLKCQFLFLCTSGYSPGCLEDALSSVLSSPCQKDTLSLNTANLPVYYFNESIARVLLEIALSV